MLTIQNHPVKLCDQINRRDWLHVGGLGALGLSMSNLAPSSAVANESRSFGKAKRCIILFLLGGPPQHETWDPKPDAPAEVRGEFKPISTATTGLQVGELMPNTARLTNRIAVLRAMSTDDNAHTSSGYWMLTGYPHSPKNKENGRQGPPNDYPCLAATVRHLKGDTANLPASVRLPEEIWNTGRIVWPGQDAGRLGPSADPWLLTCDPHKPDFKVPNVSLPADVPALRLKRRGSLLSQLNGHLASIEKSGAIDRWSGLKQRTFEMLQSPQARSAFAIDQESAKMRDRYGRNRFGQSVLLGRRMLEAGVSMVQVNWTRWEHDTSAAPAWDTHAKNNERLKKDLMPQMDLAYSALLEDLAERGMLDDTLVVWMGEFGRTPKFNRRGGRDHWGHVYSTALAGGGIQGGVVFGSSDPKGAYPREGRVEPQDLSATIFHCLGHRPETEIYDKLGRPLVLSTGEPIAAVL